MSGRAYREGPPAFPATPNAPAREAETVDLPGHTERVPVTRTILAPLRTPTTSL